MPDQVDWRALEREASPGRAVGRLLRDQREARGLASVRGREKPAHSSSASRSHRRRSLRQAARRRLHTGLPARLCGACRSRRREGDDGLSSFRSGSDQASPDLARGLPDRREARADRFGRADRAPGGRRGLRRLALSAARAGGRRREGAAGAGSPAGVASGDPGGDRYGCTCVNRACAASAPTAAAPGPTASEVRRTALPSCLPKRGRRGATAWRRRRSRKPRARRLRRRSSLPFRRRHRRRRSLPFPRRRRRRSSPRRPSVRPRLPSRRRPSNSRASRRRPLPSRRQWRAPRQPKRPPPTFR